MNVLRLASGLIGMVAGIIIVGYALGWMVQRLAQVIAGAIALVSGALLFLFSANTVLEEVRENKELANAVKSTRKRLKDQDVSKMVKSARQRNRHLRREASKLWR